MGDERPPPTVEASAPRKLRRPERRGGVRSATGQAASGYLHGNQGAQQAHRPDVVTGGARAASSGWGSVTIDAEKRLASVTLGVVQIPWATVTWTGTKPKIELIGRARNVGYEHGYGIGLRIRGGRGVEVSIDRTAEDQAVAKAYANVTVFSYQIATRGTVRITDVDGVTTRQGPVRLRELYGRQEYPDSLPQMPLYLPGLIDLDPLASARERRRSGAGAADEAFADRQSRLRTNRWLELSGDNVSYSLLEHAKEAATAVPEIPHLIYEVPDGGFIIVPLTEHQLQQLVRDLRPGVSPGLRARDTGSFGVVGLFIGGAEVTDVSSLSAQWYRDPFQAAMDGPDGDLGECEVYRMGASSFGRRDLGHEEALARWSQFNGLSRDEVMAQVSGSGRFHSLWVRQHGEIIELDGNYFQARDEFLEAAGASSWADQAYAMSARRVRDFIAIETARPDPDPRVLIALYRGEGFAKRTASITYYQVVRLIQKIALQTLVAGIDSLRPLAEDRDTLAATVVGLPSMDDKGRRQWLQSIGAKGSIDQIADSLGDPTTAHLIAFGHESTYTTKSIEYVLYNAFREHDEYIITTETHRWSLDRMQGWARDNIAELEKAAEQLRNGDVTAVHLEGELGDHVRRVAYKRLGFTVLDPSDFPHDSVTGEFMPDAMDATSPAMSSLRERLFANHAARLEDIETLESIFTIGVTALATVVLIFVSAGFGSLVAGLAFAEGTALYTGASLLATGLAFQGGMELVHLLSTGEWASDDWAEFLTMGAFHAATFGMFRVLNRVFLGVGASVASRTPWVHAEGAALAATKTAQGVRISLLGATFIGLGLADYYAEHGEWPTGSKLWLFLYENVLTLALLEGGGLLARPYMKSLAEWARERRLGEFAERIRALRADELRHLAELADLMQRPQAGTRDGPRLVETQRSLLQRQVAIIDGLRQRSRFSGDARVAEAAHQRLAELNKQIQGLEQAKFLGEQKIAPHPEQPIAENDTPSIFTYRAGERSIADFKAYYGEANVTVGEAGRIRVRHGDRELLFRPRAQGELPGSFAGGPRRPGGVRAIPRAPELAKWRKDGLLVARRLGLHSADIAGLRGMRPGARRQPGSLLAAEVAITRVEAQVGRRLGEVSAAKRERALAGLEPASVQRLLNASPKLLDPMDVDAIASLQGSLEIRRSDLLKRADGLDVSHPALDAIRPRKLRISQRIRPEPLAEADLLIATAEREVGINIDRQLLQKTTKLRGSYDATAMEQIRAGELQDVSQVELAEALYPVRSTGIQPGPGVVRGLLFALRGGPDGPVSVRKLLEAGKNYRVADRYFVLETAAKLYEARVNGVGRMLAEMAQTRDKFKGGLFACEYVRMIVGIERVAGLEMRADGRVIDVLSRNGNMVELKNWSQWRGDSLGEQAPNDFRNATQEFTIPEGLRRLRYVFRHPAPRTVAEIRQFLREHLLETMAANEVAPKMRKRFTAVFDSHRDLIEIPRLQRTGNVPLPDIDLPHVTPTLQQLEQSERPRMQILLPVEPEAPGLDTGPDW